MGAQFTGKNLVATFGLCAAPALVHSYDQTDPLIIDSARIETWGTVPDGAGTGKNFQTLTWPLVRDFSNMPGQGILVAPSPLYGFVEGVAMPGACYMYIKLFYTYVELSTDEYWQLIESRRIVGI